MINRCSGILMHITSLPSPYGIGTFGKEAYDFVDFLEKSGQSLWQILPISPTGYGDSPYQSYSAFAGNPYFIDLPLLTEVGLLKKEDYENINFGKDCTKVDYNKIFDNKIPILKKAFKNSTGKFENRIKKFREDNKTWIEDYALYMSIKERFNLKPWQEWDKKIKLRDEKILEKYREELREEIDYWVFLQYIFFQQWADLKGYANDKRIKIIGDIPIYVAEDSADTWANSEVFVLDENKNPTVISGCPPDAFSAEGQLWGNPIYRWDYLDKIGYGWWIERVKASSKIYDITRIDHFRGFEAYWEVPAGEDTAIKGKWVKGPGMKLFNKIKEEIGEIEIIAEDLGFLTKEVIDFRVTSGYPGMKVLEFAFDAKEESDYLPHNYDKNCVVYTGTHDNDTINGWMENANEKDIDFAIKYLKLTEEEGYNWGFIRGALSSVANLAVIQMQDYLGLSSEARMNIPSTVGGNWQWRINKNDLTDELAKNIYNITRLYGRL